MHLIPLSLLLSLFLAVDSGRHVAAVNIPFTVRTTSTPPPDRRGLNRFSRRSSATLVNNGNAQYIANVTVGGEALRVLIDTGSSDLWVAFPDNTPSTTDLGKSLTLNYAIGSASGSIKSTSLEFQNFTIADQAFLQVSDTSSFTTDIHQQGYDGLMGLGPNDGSQIYDKIDKDSAGSVLTRIFQQSGTGDDYITFLLDRKGDPTQAFTGQMTISEVVKGFENITSQPKIDVENVHKLLESQQHWQALTDKNNGIIGPDGQVIQYDSIVPKAPDGQLVAVFDSGFTFNQVPRDISDAIYGRVQGAVYDSKNEWWTVPCGQLLNVSLNIGGQNYPVHPMDTVDSSFNIKNENGTTVCIGSFQPITTAFSLLGNYDMILGMSFLRNTYTLLNFGDWIDGSSNSNDPYIQLLSVTDVNEAHSDFVTARFSGTDTTSDPKWDLLPADQMQHSPVSAEEKKKKYQEMILSRWPYIFVGCLVFVLLVVGFVIWRCCCRGRRQRKKQNALKNKSFIAGVDQTAQANPTYVPLQEPAGGWKSVSSPDVHGHYGSGGYGYQGGGYK